MKPLDAAGQFATIGGTSGGSAVARPKSPNYTPIVVFAVVAAVAAGAGWWLLRPGAPEKAGPAAANAVPALPAGPLQYAGGNVTEAHYLDAASVKRSGTLAQADVLVVGRTVDAIAHQYAMVAKHETLDCAGKTISGEMAGEYDAAGKLKNNEILAGSVGRAIDSSDFEAVAICDNKPAPAWRAAADWRAAQREVQTPPQDAVKVAEADPKNAAAWATLCQAGARGRWRTQSPKDCDHAVSLQPDDTATRLNRAYLSMAIGHNPAAQSDFRAILAKTPDHPAALYGQSLIEGMAKDQAASKRDRTRALGVDPLLPDWVTLNFKILISAPYDRP